MKINYNNRKFTPVQNSDTGETSSDTVFHYKQSGDIVTAYYQGGAILKGHLIGIVNAEGKISMSYHQVNQAGELRTGVCHSTPEILSDGRIRLHENWRWTNGDLSEGNSVIEELREL